MRSRQTLRKYLNNIIFHGKYPVEDVEFAATSLQFKYVPEFFDFKDSADQLRHLDLGVFPSSIFLQMPGALAGKILEHYLAFLYTLREEMSAAFEQYRTDDWSRAMWAIYRHAPAGTVITSAGELNDFQRAWISYHITEDRGAQTTKIAKVLEALYPWLNPQLYMRYLAKKDEGNGEPEIRQNAFINSPELGEDAMYARAAALFKKDKING